jgi:NADH:ubiquinone oxidoreductase subunit C
MDITSSLQNAEALLNLWMRGMSYPDTTRLDVVLPPRELKSAVNILKKARWGYLSAITCLDHPAAAVMPPQENSTPPAPDGSIEVLYQFCEGAAVLTIRVTVPYSAAIIPSICSIIPYATLYEREAMELFGVIFKNTPDSDRLVLPDDWPVGVYPLRKSFTGFTDPKKEELEG